MRLSSHALGGVDLRAAARPHLDELVDETGETATLSVPGDRDAVTIDFVLSRASVASVARVGRPSIAHATATGKVMLAFAAGGLPRRAAGAGTRTAPSPTPRGWPTRSRPSAVPAMHTRRGSVSPT